MGYSTFLLDLDHTLLDSDRSEILAFDYTMRSAGINDPDTYVDVYRTINRELWARVEQGELRPQEVRTLRFERLVEQKKIKADPLQMAEDFVEGLGSNGSLYPGARDVLGQLSETARLALVTNGLSEVQRARIKRLDIEQYFDSIIISAEIGAAKPGTKIFDIVFSELGSPPRNEVLMVGDSLSSDIRGGQKYGIATCWYNPKRRQLDIDLEPKYEISDLYELLKFVGL
jgi:2-haloacid dehalogenase|tara:strand:+ start:204 stop:890 length:687 start_codon:yes stop_codon:yes gene_type:complete